MNRKSFLRQGRKIPYSLSFLRRLDEACAQRNSRKSFFAIDNTGNIHAAVYVVWDQFSAYYLMGGGDPKYRTSGAHSLLLWETIKFTSKFVSSFNFEGSMIEPVERFFRAFGAEQKPYFNITRVDSKVLKTLFAGLSILR